MIKENIVLPISILIDQRRFTYQERMFVYFWASRSLSYDFNFDILQYAAFRGFPLQSCSTNLRSILKRLKQRKLLEYSINKDAIFVRFDKSFHLDSNGEVIYLKKNEINALDSVVSLRVFEILCCISLFSFCVKVPIDTFKTMVGIKPAMYGTNAAFFSRLIKPSLKKITQHTRISVTSKFDGEDVTFYVVSQM